MAISMGAEHSLIAPPPWTHQWASVWQHGIICGFTFDGDNCQTNTICE